ncbi:Uma2 family endonuclease [Dictyobacter kobayashii]|nr:Uma2 family endonuclease [Dictyobacter kobayashii]
MALPEYLFMSVEDYLALDDNSHDARYEYLDGEVRMLAGESTYHSALISRLGAMLGNALENSSCWTYNSDMRLVLSESYYVYPDLSVSCDENDHTLDNSILHPCIVVDVLSPSTEAIDTGEKLRAYLEHPTIQEYVIVDSLSIWIEVYHREEDGWKFRTYGPNSMVKLEHLKIQFSVDTLYRGMDLQATRRLTKRKKANNQRNS